MRAWMYFGHLGALVPFSPLWRSVRSVVPRFWGSSVFRGGISVPSVVGPLVGSSGFVVQCRSCGCAVGRRFLHFSSGFPWNDGVWRQGTPAYCSRVGCGWHLGALVRVICRRCGVSASGSSCSDHCGRGAGWCGGVLSKSLPCSRVRLWFPVYLGLCR